MPATITGLQKQCKVAHHSLSEEQVNNLQQVLAECKLMVEDLDQMTTAGAKVR